VPVTETKGCAVVAAGWMAARRVRASVKNRAVAIRTGDMNASI